MTTTPQIPIVHNADYYDFAELIAEFVKDQRTVLSLTNSVVDKTNEVTRREVDDALDQAESPFRRIMDQQEEELQGVYSRMHAAESRNDALERELLDVREQLAVRVASSNATLAAETRRGIEAAKGSAKVMRFLDKSQKINAIKEVRLLAGIGLKAAKDAVESKEVQDSFDNDCWCSICTGIE